MPRSEEGLQSGLGAAKDQAMNVGAFIGVVDRLEIDHGASPGTRRDAIAPSMSRAMRAMSSALPQLLP